MIFDIHYIDHNGNSTTTYARGQDTAQKVAMRISAECGHARVEGANLYAEYHNGKDITPSNQE